MKGFEVRFVNQNLPLCVSYPRTGAIWCNAMFEYYFNRKRAPDSTQGFIDKSKVPDQFMWFHTHDSALDITTTNPKGAFFLLRDPVDTIYSYCQVEGWPKNEKKVESLCRQWSRLIDKWLLGKNARLCIRYEDLVNNPEKSFKDISTFFDMEFDKERMEKTIELSKKDKFLKGSTTKYHNQNLLTDNYKNQREIFRQNFSEQIYAMMHNEKYKPYFTGEISWND